MKRMQLINYLRKEKTIKFKYSVITPELSAVQNNNKGFCFIFNSNNEIDENIILGIQRILGN